jgi:hypothetical protein
VSDQDITTRVELLEGATSTIIRNQDMMLIEQKNVTSRLDRIESLLQLVMQTVNEINKKLPKQPEE